MVHAPCVIRNKVESCSDNIIITVGIAISPAPVRKKKRHQGVVMTSGAFTLTSVIFLWGWSGVGCFTIQCTCVVVFCENVIL